MNNLDRIFQDSMSVTEYGRRYAAYMGDVLAGPDFSAVEKFVEILEVGRQAGRNVLFGEGAR